MCVQGLASPMEYTVITAFLLAGVAGSFAAVILGGYEIVCLIAFVLYRRPTRLKLDGGRA